MGKDSGKYYTDLVEWWWTWTTHEILRSNYDDEGITTALMHFFYQSMTLQWDINTVDNST